MSTASEQIVVTVTGPNSADTHTFVVSVDIQNGTASPLSIPILGTNAGTDQIVATMPSHGYTSNQADITWQAVNNLSQISNGPVTVTPYQNLGMVRGWPGFGAALAGATTGNSLVFNQVFNNTPIPGFVASGCGASGGYKQNPMQITQQTNSGQFAGNLTIAGTSTNESSGNFPGFVLDIRSSLVVKTAGFYTFFMNYANVSSAALYIGGGATFSSQNVQGGNTGNVFPATGPNTGFPLAIAATNMSAVAHPFQVSSYIYFPNPGTYPIQAIYNQYLSVQCSYDNNGYWEITYLAGQQNQNIQQGYSGGYGLQPFPVSNIAVAPPPGVAGTGQLRLSPTGGTAGLKLQGTTDTLTLTIQNVTYTTFPYVPLLEGTAGHLFVTNGEGTQPRYQFQTYNGNAITGDAARMTAAVNDGVLSLSGSNTSWQGRLSLNTDATNNFFDLTYDPSTRFDAGVDKTELTITAEDIAWFFPTGNTFDLFQGASGDITLGIEIDYMVNPGLNSPSYTIAPTSGVSANGAVHNFTLTLSKPFSGQQQGTVGNTGNTIVASVVGSGGVTVGTLVPQFNGKFLTGWIVPVTIPNSSVNGSFTLTPHVSGNLTYLNGTVFTTGGVTYINGPATTVNTVGSYQAPVPFAFSPAGPTVSGTVTLSGTAYTFDNNPMTMQFQYKIGSAVTNIGGLQPFPPNGGVGTIVVSGQTAYTRKFNLSWAVPAGLQNFLLGYTATDTVSTLSTQWFNGTTYNPTSGGGGGSCFTGNVAIQTPHGDAEFAELEDKFELVNETGTHWAERVVHEDYAGWMLEIAPGRLVTLDHLMKDGTEWLVAEQRYAGLPRVWFEGTVYNAHVLSDDPQDQHYILWNGDVAHNLKAGGGCFSGNCEFETPTGYMRFDEAPGGWFDIKNETGVHKARLVVHRNWHEEMINMGDGYKLVTFGHHIRTEKGVPFAAAIKVLPLRDTVDFTGTVYNLEIDTDDEASRHYVLRNGIVAHNVVKA
jgi:hypothetical protein